MRLEMWDEAEALFTEIINDLSTRSYDREQAQERLMQIEKQRSRLEATTQMTAKTQGMNIGVQRAFAKEYMDRGETEKAMAIYEQIVQAMPEDLESRAQLATLYSQQNLHDKAIETWKALLETDPENTKYQDGLINSYQTSGKVGEALALAQQYIDADPDIGAHYARLAKLHKDENQIDAAITAYEKASELTPGNAKIYQELAELYLRKDNLTSAEKAFQEAIRYTSQNWNRRNLERQLIDLYARQGKLEEMLQKAETEGTLTSTMQEERAKHYRENGELEKAVSVYEKALDMTPQGYEREDLASTLIRVYVEADKIDSAVELYEAELLANSSSARRTTSYGSGITIYYGGDEARQALIKAYKDQGKLETLKTVFENRREKEADNPNVLEMVADIYRNANDHEKAAETYQTLSTVQSDPKNILSAYYAAVALHQNQQPELATAQLERAETLLSSSNSNQRESFLGALATICFKAEMYAPAIKLANDAITAAQRSNSTWELEYLYEILGECCLDAKQYAEAFNAYQQLANIARSNYKRENAQTKMHQAATSGNLYEKWIPQRLKQVQENPDSLDARLDLAEAYEFSDKVDEAIVEYQKLSEHQPDNSQWYKKLGALYEQRAQQRHETDMAGHAQSELTQAASAYESALQLEPNSYELYRSLAHIHTQGEHPLNAEDVYRRALEAPLTQREHEAALKAILDLYPDDAQAEKHIALLEELKSKMERSAVLHELLGDTYTKTGDTEKAEIAYAEWAKIRNKEVNKSQRASDYHQFAVQLLSRNITPEIALELAKRATQNTNYWNYHLTLGRAYLANGEYDAAREQFKHSLNTLDPSNGSYFDFTRLLWTQLTQAGKSAKHEKAYVEMITQLINELSDTPAISARGNAVLAQFYLDNHQPEKAQAYIHKTTFIPETAWSVIGPFDNTNGAGYDKAFIPEAATQLDTTLLYDGHNGQIGWTQQTDKTFDGYVDFETIFGGDLNWVAAYAWTTLTVPDERIAHIYFGSDDQAKIWLNGESVFTDSTAHSVAIDHATIPVTLKPGKNTLLVKVCDEEIFWGFYLRITDTDGKPFDDLIINESEEN